MAPVAIGAFAVAIADAPAATAAHVRPGVGSALFVFMLIMIFAPKIASSVDVLVSRSARRSYGGAARFVSNVVSEILFSFLLSPIMALTHTMFLCRLFLLGRGGAWNSQMREGHAVPWRLALATLWPHTLAGWAIVEIVARTAAVDGGYALMTAGGLALSVPFAVATASPSAGTFLARIRVGRIPEEAEPPTALVLLRLPALPAVSSEPHKQPRRA
jgi:membrane glycosyltransferase